ncbi:hypothetical protein KGF56_001271 [Candida oxycetoniae]|uniref:DUF1776-domain-containing protein n=1 Tax=Candida oxycetoniae TaxID=497107 RepID=A0AAI9WZ65_9ASCO|nr:uncharacterized protein KGF56_001271 [Candida oxycetoniae]KAI3406052.2 hypothetical protein KGF56_001271 [Candida oxycetoniae]
MVAEPVQVTVEALQKLYSRVNQFVNAQQDKLVNSEYYNQFFNIESSSPPVVQVRSFAAESSASNLFSSIFNTIAQNKVGCATVLGLGLGIGCYSIYKKWDHIHHPEKAKRRVPKLANGAKRDVALIVGSPTEPITRLVALDFERRGFIVYLTALDSLDLKYLSANPVGKNINYIDFSQSSIEDNLARFKQILKTPVVPFFGAEPHYLFLKSVIFTPCLYFPVGPIENIGINTWHKLTDRLLTYLKLFSSGMIQLVRSSSSKVILINPNNTSCLNLPYHAPESIFQHELMSLFTVLARELKQHGVYVTQVKLGNVSLTSEVLNSNSRIESLVNSEVRAWTSEMRELYTKDFTRAQFKSHRIKASGSGKGESIKSLFHLLFDLTYSSSPPSVSYCGKGARWCDYIAKVFPNSWIELFII